MKIHIMGASCAGSTTLGNALAALWGYPYFDTDKYFWIPSEIPYTIRRTFEERNRLLRDDMKAHEHVIVGGSLINWGCEWQHFFDLVVFLYVPPDIRMKRLRERELSLVGQALSENPNRAENYQRFLAWAAGYDDNQTQGRNLKTHQDWLSNLPCEVLEIFGDTSIDERIRLVTNKVGVIEAHQ